MIVVLGWRTPGTWNMFAGDRSALFDALKEAADPSSIWPARGACLPLEGRLRLILQQTAGAWNGDNNMPRWKMYQIQNPDIWEVRLALDPDPKPKLMSKVSFNQFGLAGVDVKSHQTRTAIPYPVVFPNGATNRTPIAKGPMLERDPLIFSSLVEVRRSSCAKTVEWLRQFPTSSPAIFSATSPSRLWQLS